MKAFSSHIALAMGGEKDKIWVQKRVLQQIIITQDEFIKSKVSLINQKIKNLFGYFRHWRRNESFCLSKIYLRPLPPLPKGNSFISLSSK
ncbi:hypothetical protein DN748_03085 [Sinomicrobium soli]|nr:hypothetical protein DN748_03085 [Sinomicrobium sp. N-1-3-6]